MPDAKAPAASMRVPDPTMAVVGGGLAAAALAAAAAMVMTGLKPDEGKRNATYLDIAGIPTSCYGHRADGEKVGTMHTDAQCEAILSTDVQVRMNGVARCVPALATRPANWSASTRMAFNTGVQAFCGSSTARAFNAGQWRAGCEAMLAWDKAHVGGKIVVVPGLLARRQRERAQCLAGLVS